MTDHPPTSSTLLEELDARQNDVLTQLDELNERIELLLRDLTKTPQPENSAQLDKSA